MQIMNSVDTDLRQLDPDRVRNLAPAKLFDLEGKVAVVTGAGGGIGAALAAGLAAAGAEVMLTDHPRADLDGPGATISEAGGRVSTYSCDLTSDNAPKEVVAAAIERHGGIDILVNNAGVNRRERIFDVERESWDAIAAVNLRVPFELSREAAREMNGGAIVHIGSLNNAIGLAGVSVYGAHKAALCQSAKSMAIEWAEKRIRVNALCPGFMLTPLSKPLWDDEQRGGWILERSLFRRPGHPEELVGALLLLVSDAGSFITGQTFYVDGGWLAGTAWDESGK